LFHQQYPKRCRGKVTNRVKPADNVSRTQKGCYQTREGKVNLLASKRKGARVNGMASKSELQQASSAVRSQRR
jgi:hypothetical protein